jgi:hypothetical protein
MILSDENLFLYAAKYYYNPKFIDAEEFQEDLRRIKYIKRLLNRYLEGGVISERLILNHLIVIFNVFGVEPGMNILRLKLDDSQWPVIKPFLLFLRGIDEGDMSEIPMDPVVVQALRNI